MKVIVDTDLASYFAKSGSFDLLLKLFTKNELIITPEIYNELLVPLS